MYYLLYFLFLFAVINGYFRLARRLEIVDRPNIRSSHNEITIRGGGIIFYIGALICFVSTNFQYPVFMMGLTAIAAISFIDDIIELSPKIRLSIHFIAVSLMLIELGAMQLSWWYLPAALVVVTGIINAYNFMDGINGIMGAFSFAVLSGLWMVNHYQVSFIDPEYIYLTAISLIVFGIYNFRRNAKCFAGDVGSISIAFILLFMIGKLIMATHNFVYLLFMVVYGVDSFLTIIHRLFLKENILKAHRKHLYQILANEAKMSKLFISAAYAVLQIVINLLIIYWISIELSSKLVIYYSTILCLMLVSFYILLLRKYYHLHIENS